MSMVFRQEPCIMSLHVFFKACFYNLCVYLSNTCA